MCDRAAIKIALDLVHVPSQVRLRRAEPLPQGVEMLLRIAGGDEEARRMAANLTGRSPDTVERAAAFFIEQILFAPDADAYRVLGVGPDASASDLRRNVALLLRWLHPDVDRQGGQSIFAGRVTSAWNDLKTSERRAAYDNYSRVRSERRKMRKKLSGAGQRRSGLERAMQSHRRIYKIRFLRQALLKLFNLAALMALPPSEKR